MAHLDIAAVSYTLSDGRPLLSEVSFSVGEGERIALIGANGAGKSTLLKIVMGELKAESGAVARTGSVGVMRQFIGGGTVHELLLSVSPPALREVAERLIAAEARMTETGSTKSQMAFANAVTAWGDAGGYDAEVLWDTCTVAALGMPYDDCRDRPLATLSGGEQKRLALEALLRGPDEILILDEPDNSLDVPGKRWLEDQLRATEKGILFVSHDRELLARTATTIVTLELGAAGSTAWSHPGSFGSYHEARERRFARLEEQRKRWDEEHAKLRELMLMYKQKSAYNSDMASRYRAAQTRLARFEEAGPPEEQPHDQHLEMRLRGGRTGKRVLMCEQLELVGLMFPFDFEAWYGDRIAVLGSNGSGKSQDRKSVV